MADFDLTQTDQQVQNILNDAQGAMGASAQTTLTTEYVMLKDTNGVYHKILKSSFTEAIRDVLAGLLVNNDKGTTISQIAAIASGDFGSITPANLASVLGGRDISFIDPYHISSAEQLDSINSNLPVTYYYALNSAGIGGEGLLIHLQPVKEVGVGYVEHNELKVQIFFKYDFSSVKTRMYDWSTQTWTEFKQVPLT